MIAGITEIDHAHQRLIVLEEEFHHLIIAANDSLVCETHETEIDDRNWVARLFGFPCRKDKNIRYIFDREPLDLFCEKNKNLFRYYCFDEQVFGIKLYTSSQVGQMEYICQFQNIHPEMSMDEVMSLLSFAREINREGR